MCCRYVSSRAVATMSKLVSTYNKLLTILLAFGVAGTGDATDRVETGDSVTVDSSGGEVGRLWEGELPFEIQERDVGQTPDTKTKIMLNLANPSLAFESSFLPNAG